MRIEIHCVKKKDRNTKFKIERESINKLIQDKRWSITWEADSRYREVKKE